MMTIRSLIFILFTFPPGICFAQTGAQDTAKYNAIIKQQANEMSSFLMTGNFKGSVKYTNPKVIEMLGGDEVMVTKLESGLQEMKADSFYFISVKIGQHSAVIEADSKWQCIVPQVLEMGVPNGRYVNNSALVAISRDKGHNWTFIDAGMGSVSLL